MVGTNLKSFIFNLPYLYT